MRELDVKEQVVAYCQLLHQKGYLAATDGNVSVRLGPGRILITPTGVHKGFLRPEELIVIDDGGRVVEGRGAPSGEVAMHLTALRLRPDRPVVMHAHPPTCIALSLFKNLRLNGVLPEVILSVGRITVVPYARPISQALGESLVGFVEKGDALILERHGTLTLGRSVHDAYALVERLEHAAQVLHRAHLLGRPPLLPDHEARALEEMYERSRP
ncbi:MAG: class II aldolase/adducin family protein [Myxococcales bacterium]|nr:class II aldolase/adducin family protein [Myxococcales bacterium]